MANVTKKKKLIEDQHVAAVKRLRSGDLLEMYEETCVRTDAPYDSSYAVVSINDGTCYYLEGYEGDVTLIETGDEFMFIQE